MRNQTRNQTRNQAVILNVPVDAVTPEEALSALLGFLREEPPRPRLLVTPNPEMIMLANRDAGFMRIMRSADLVVPDGVGVVLASRLGKVKIRGRVTGCDLLPALFGKIAESGRPRSVYLFGAAPGVAEAARDKLAAKYPGLMFIGARDGYQTPEREKTMIRDIIAKKPDILVIGMSMGMAEKWADAHRELPVRLAACVGGAIDVWSGKIRRAPRIFRALGLEWLCRLLRQPSRWRRQLILPVFAWRVIRGRK